MSTVVRHYPHSRLIRALTDGLAALGKTPETVADIRLLTGGLVAGFIVLSLLIMWFYPLTDKVFRQIVREIAARRVERELTESLPRSNVNDGLGAARHEKDDGRWIYR